MEKGSKSMKKAFLNWRYYAMTIVGFVAILGVFSIPDKELPMLQWLFALLWTKTVGFGAGYAFFRLVFCWTKQDIIPELSKLITEE